ncbi:MAG: DNA repair protein RecO [Candidatus Dormibacteria bacterium]
MATPPEVAASTFADEGIVLRRRVYAEADRVLVMLTRDHGKLSVVARGARRSRSRNAAGLDLLARSELLLARGRGLAVLAQARPLGRPWPSSDLERTACGSVLAELADATLEEGHPDPALYQLVALHRERLADPGSDPRAELLVAAFQIAEVGGYRPQLSRCQVCGEPLSDRESGFLPELGGMVQGDCLRARPAARACAPATLRLLRRLEGGDLDLARRLRWTAQLRDQAEDILLAHLEHHLDRPLRAARVLAELRS